MKKLVRRSGFTLPEVLVTVTVVAVLAAVVVPAVTQYVGRGNGPASQQDIIELRTAVTGFIVDTRTNPGNLNDLTLASIPAYANLAGGVWHGPYLSSSVGTGTPGSTGQGLSSSGYASAGSASFTSNGVGLQLADTIINTGTTLQAVVIYPHVCAAVQHVDSLIDDGVATGGLFTWTTGSPCDQTHDATNVRLTLATIGKP